MSSARFLKRLLFKLSGRTRHRHVVPNEVLSKALGTALQRSDISDHLGALFFFATEARPVLLVELGTRGGESTRALLAAASLSGATLLSVDLDDCSRLSLPHQDRWRFVRADDVEFGKSGFSEWCATHGFAPRIDVLFVDTSHEYEHSVQELAVWSGHLSEHGVMIFHDTNMGGGIYDRSDGSISFGWDNQRGVIRAIEEFLGRRYDESAHFTDLAAVFAVIHFPNCNGLTVLRRVGEALTEC